jgi:hypothetical protein
LGAIVAFFLSPIGRLIGVGALALIIGGVGAGWAVAKIKDAQIDSIQAADAKADADRAKAVLAKFEIDAQRIMVAAQSYALVQGALDLKIGDIQKGLKSVIAKRPLAVGCKPDADRLRVLTDAVTAANTAAGSKPGPAVSPVNSPH